MRKNIRHIQFLIPILATVCFTIFVFTAITVSCSKNEKSSGLNDIADEYVTRGQKYYYDMEWDSAITQFNEALKINPELATAHAGLGLCYYNFLEYDRSIEALLQASKYEPNYLYFMRGVEGLITGDFDAAILEFSNAINEKFEIIYAYDLRASAYLEKGEYDKAIDDYNYIINNSPDFVSAYTGRGLSLVNGKMDFNASFIDIEEAIKRNPDNYYIRYLRGAICFDRSDIDNGFGNQDRAIMYRKIALADFDYISGIKPIYNDHYSILGSVYRYNELYDDAIKCYSKIIESTPKSFRAYRSRGYSYLKKQQFDLALKDLNTAIQINPNYAEAYSGRGDIYAATKKINQAIEDYQYALQIDPNAVWTYFDLGILYWNQMDYLNAEKMFKEVIKRGPDSIWGYYFLGMVTSVKSNSSRSSLNPEKTLRLSSGSENVSNNQKRDKELEETLKLIDSKLNNLEEATKSIDSELYYSEEAAKLVASGKHTDAIELLTQAIKKYPNHSSFFYLRGYCYLYGKNYEKALADYSNCIKIDSKNADGYYGVAQIYQVNKEYDLAERNFIKATELAENNERKALYLSGLAVMKSCIYKYEDAINYINQAINISIFSDYYYYLGSFLYMNEMKKEAEEAWLTGVKMDKFEDFEFKHITYEMLSYLYYENEQYNEALDNIEKALTLSPGNKEYLKLLEIIKNKM